MATTRIIPMHLNKGKTLAQCLADRTEYGIDTVLFPFFDGLIPEGWLLNSAEKSWKINQRDRMSLLLACCKDCIGAVSVVPEQDDKEEEREE